MSVSQRSARLHFIRQHSYRQWLTAAFLLLCTVSEQQLYRLTDDLSDADDAAAAAATDDWCSLLFSIDNGFPRVQADSGKFWLKSRFSVCLTLLEHAIANGRFVRFSLCPSIRHTRDLRLNGSRYRNAFFTARQSDVSSLWRPTFVVVSLEMHP